MSKQDIKAPKPLPPPNSDFYQLAETLPPEELTILRQVRSFMESKVAPIINKYWVEDSFPFELIPLHLQRLQHMLRMWMNFSEWKISKGKAQFILKMLLNIFDYLIGLSTIGTFIIAIFY